jgi:hypothetical protein
VNFHLNTSIRVACIAWIERFVSESLLTKPDLGLVTSQSYPRSHAMRAPFDHDRTFAWLIKTFNRVQLFVFTRINTPLYERQRLSFLLSNHPETVIIVLWRCGKACETLATATQALGSGPHVPDDL